MSAYLSPLGGAGAQFFTNAGVVLAGGKLYTYVAGSTTPQATWTDSTQAVQNANPIILDSAGRPSNEIWLVAGTNNYKFVLKDSNDVTLGTWDNITGIAASNAVQSEWISSGLTITYVSATAFTVTGDQTAVFTTNRRLQYFLATGTFYGYVAGRSYSSGTGLTTVTVAADTTVLDATLQAVSYGFFNPTNPSVPQNYLKVGDAINNTPIGNLVPSTGSFTNLASANVNITGGTISGIAGFSVPDYLQLAQGVI